jgi:D-serine deaminase-like pyridoxal phosphate-dependent protein
MSDWREPWLRARERVADLYGRHVGEPADALPTPALVVDIEALDRNLAAMDAALAGQTARLRPHTKVQKSPDIALRQVAAGAVGVAVASVWEAAAMAAAGVTDVLIANQVVPDDKVNAAAALAARTGLTVAVDDARNIDALSVDRDRLRLAAAARLRLHGPVLRRGTRDVRHRRALRRRRRRPGPARQRVRADHGEPARRAVRGARRAGGAVWPVFPRGPGHGGFLTALQPA